MGTPAGQGEVPYARYVLAIDRYDLRGLPLTVTQALAARGGSWDATDVVVQGGGRVGVRRAAGLGLEGIVARDTCLTDGAGRSTSWVK
jgi:hypothetical protein